MLIIPVIDLRDGRAVHARGGERRLYRPLSTPLCPDPDPLAVAAAYLSLYPFRTLYLDDPDAIQNQGDNQEAVGALRRRHPAIEFWLDAGRSSMDRAAPGLRPVIGTETGIDPGAVAKLAGSRHAPVLSLDFSDTGLVGDPDILRRPGCWPGEVILMSLRRVGSGMGPDLERAGALLRSRPDCRMYLGGGVRGGNDLQRLADAGLGGALVATALHTGAVDTATLDELAGEKKPRPEPGRVVG